MENLLESIKRGVTNCRNRPNQTDSKCEKKDRIIMSNINEVKFLESLIGSSRIQSMAFLLGI